MKKRWAATLSYSTARGKVNFVGRTPVLVEDDAFRDELLRCGVFVDLPGKHLRYIGRSYIVCKDGSRCYVDKDGFIEYDEADLDADLAESLRKEMADP